MARQHFYSRVPFRVSMFNRADGFDTFACSEGIEREFIDKELNVVDENKPTQEEAVLIRKGELAPVFCQFTAKDGTLVQSCTTYLPLDYTGERSSYMVHNLLFSPQETESLFFSPDRAPINTDMFDHDIGHFDITGQYAKPNGKYPTLEYTCKPSEDTQWMVDEIDNAMLQRFIYCALAAACGNIKSVYLYFNDLSNEYALRFFNTVYSIFPYYLRPQISFATRIADISRYQSLKIKCLSMNTVVPPSRGAMLNFRTRQFTGMKDEDVQSWRQIVEFFFNMLENDAVRREFLVFADHAVKEVPALAQPSLKMLNNLVFLFRCSSGLFEEKLVLSTDDRLLEYFTIYEKYRNALSNEFRTNAAKSLERYPDTHTAIPPKLFAKISKIYPTDMPAVKYIIMEVVLRLIHMDIMRDKLFQFVRNNYATQDEASKAEIIKNVSRVFYGGFLQVQILSFFQQIFLDESPDSQKEIMEKLLLSIRNKEVKSQIMEFLMTHFKAFSPEIRHMVYGAALEHIQEGDDLASQLMDLIDANILSESDEEQAWFSLKLISAAKAEQRRRTHPMIKLISLKQGYCSKTVLDKVFNGELGKKAYSEVVSGFCGGTLKDLALSLKQALPLFPDIDEESTDRLFGEIKETLSEEQKKPDLISVIAADKIIAECYEEEEEPFAVLFWQDFAEAFVAPAVRDTIPDVFRYLNQPQVFGEALAVAEKYDSVKGSDGYRMMRGYAEIVEALEKKDMVAMLLAVDRMPEDTIRRKQMSDYMKKNLAEKIDGAPVPVMCCASGIISYLKGGHYDFPGMYDKARQKIEETEPAPQQPAGKKGAPAVDNGIKAVENVLAFGNTVNLKCGDHMKEAIYSDGSSLNGVFNAYMGLKKNQEPKKLTAAIEALRPENNTFVLKCKDLIKGSAKQSFFASLFKKK